MKEKSTPNKEKEYFVVDIPNVKASSIFILMRALGFVSDKEIIECVLHDLRDNEEYIDSFITSIHDAGELFHK